MVPRAVLHLVVVQKAVLHLVVVQKAVPHLEVVQLEELHFHHYQLEELHLEAARYNQEVVLHYQEAARYNQEAVLPVLHYHELVLHYQEAVLHYQEAVHSPHPLEAVLDPLVHHFEDNQVHKGCHHNLGFVLFHPEEAEGQLVNT